MLAPITRENASTTVKPVLEIPVNHLPVEMASERSLEFSQWLESELESLEEKFASFHTAVCFKSAMGR